MSTHEQSEDATLNARELLCPNQVTRNNGLDSSILFEIPLSKQAQNKKQFLSLVKENTWSRQRYLSIGLNIKYIFKYRYFKEICIATV
jgi:hypothetical protein